MSSVGAAPRAAVPVTMRVPKRAARTARSRAGRRREGKARSAQNALKHGMRAEKYVVLPDEDAAEFAGLEAALVEELAPVGALQTVLARRVAVAAWRLARADRMEAELFEERAARRRRARARPDPRRQRHALVRDAAALPRRGHGRVLARAQDAQGAPGRAACPRRHVGRGVCCSRADRSSPPAQMAHRPIPDRPAARQNTNEPRPPAQPDEPERAAPRRLEYVVAEPSISDRMLHEPAALWLPNEPESGRAGCTGVRRAASGRLP